LLLLLPQDAPFNCFWDNATRVQYYYYPEREKWEKKSKRQCFLPLAPITFIRFYDAHVKTIAIIHHIVYVVYTLLIYNLYCIISYPNDCVEFGHCYLFRSFHSRGYLLLVLQQYTKQMHYNTVWMCIHDLICHSNNWTYLWEFKLMDLTKSLTSCERKGIICAMMAFKRFAISV